MFAEKWEVLLSAEQDWEETMGFDSPARGRGGGRGGFSSGDSWKQGGFKPRGGSPGGGFRGRGGGGGRGFNSPDNRRGGGGDRGRGFSGNRGGAVSQNYRGRGGFSPRGGRGNFSPREGFSPRGGRGNFTPREGGSPHGGRGSFTPRGNQRGFTPRGGRGSSDFRGAGRGARGSFSEKRKVFENDEEDDININSHKVKKAKSTSNTPVHAKPTPKRAKHEESDDDDDEDEEMVAPVNDKKKFKGKSTQEEEDEESDEDEEQVEPIMSTPAVKQKQAEDRKSALKSGKSTDVKKKVDVSAAPTPVTSSKKVPVTPHPQKKGALEVTPKSLPKKSDGLEAPAKKVTEKKVPVLSKEQAPQQGVKRKAVANDLPSKHIKLDQSTIVDEENKRRQERDERSLFIKGFPKNTKTKELEELHADIETVRHRRGSSFAWIVFRNEAACEKAHGTLSKAKVGGRNVIVDFCGSKSSKSPATPKAKVGGRNVIVDFCGSKSSKSPATPKESVPLNPLELYINGLPANVTKEDIRNVFRAAVSINIPKGRPHDLRRAFILFSTEEDAKLAFDKSKGLKLAGRSVEVFFARMRKEVLPNATVKPSKGATSQNASAASVKKPTAVPKVDESDDSDEEEVESSDEGIEEVVGSSSEEGHAWKGLFASGL
ncbi:hypothetical protein OSTOST_05454 [Ostertagia ostertagi]